jgi:hypothetical protein
VGFESQDNIVETNEETKAIVEMVTRGVNEHLFAYQLRVINYIDALEKRIEKLESAEKLNRLEGA